MKRVMLLTTVLVSFLCTGCMLAGPSESERALQTQVASQATQLAELREEEPSPRPTTAASPPASSTPTPSVAAPAAAPTELPTVTIPPVPPTETALSGGVGSGAGPCEIVAEDAVSVYDRPSSAAGLFGSMYAGLRVTVEGRAADGWLGFEPGVAQAANIGVFRLRWVRESSAIRLEGTCDRLPKLVGPPPGICFTMPMQDVRVYAEPDASSEVAATMVLGDYAGVVGVTVDDWAQVDLTLGNTGLDLSGWIAEVTLNLNGPCDGLPTIAP